MQNILIIGATSAIAVETARLFAQRGDKLYLLARNTDQLSTVSDDLKVRGASVVVHNKMDANNFDEHEALIDAAFQEFDTIDVVLIAHGTLPDQKACEESFEIALIELNTNAISIISMLTHIANRLENQRSGTIAVITSVAGDRGRQSNYVYGAAKSMVSTFLSGLRNRLYPFHVNVLDIKPGFVDTPMTRDFKKGLLWVKPDVVASSIVNAIAKHRHEIYTPFFWRVIMLVIRSIPGPVFNRLKL